VRFQGQGLGKRAVRVLLDQARDENSWGVVHAFPATSNAASNGAMLKTCGSVSGRQREGRTFPNDPVMVIE
jgi:RimJ/RimL family protein N-acetyltransferase